MPDGARRHHRATAGKVRPIVEKDGQRQPAGRLVRTRGIPRFDVCASAGPGRLAAPEDFGVSSFIALRAAWLRTLGVSPEPAQFLVADGDSMRETILHGDLLLIDRLFDRVVTNAIYVVVLAGAVMVKRLQLLRDGAIMLISDNPLYQPERSRSPKWTSCRLKGG